MFICGFISFTVWPSFTGRIISLSRSHIPPLRPPALALCLSAPRQAIKILSATLLKNYGSPFRSPAPLSSVLVRLSLKLDRLARADRPRTRCLSFSPSHYRASLSLLVRVLLPLIVLSSSRLYIRRSTPLRGLLFAVPLYTSPLSRSFAFRASRANSHSTLFYFCSDRTFLSSSLFLFLSPASSISFLVFRLSSFSC